MPRFARPLLIWSADQTLQAYQQGLAWPACRYSAPVGLQQAPVVTLQRQRQPLAGDTQLPGWPLGQEAK